MWMVSSLEVLLSSLSLLTLSMPRKRKVVLVYRVELRLLYQCKSLEIIRLEISLIESFARERHRGERLEPGLKY